MSASLVGSEMCIRDRPLKTSEKGGGAPPKKVTTSLGLAMAQGTKHRNKFLMVTAKAQAFLQMARTDEAWKWTLGAQ
eukprot:12500007-Alexandrium_andersonii.AAC.1